MPDTRWPIEDRPLADLWLDPRNVRIPDRRPGESSIAAYMVEAEEVLDLATDIARDGYIDNEIPVVTEEGGRLLVLEGNRRITALKLLGGIVAADGPNSPAYRDPRVDRIVRRYSPESPTTIRVMIAPSRAAAQPLLARLHTANPKKSWLREQQAVFYHAQLSMSRTVDDLRAQFPAADDIPRFIRMGEMRELIRSLHYPDESLRDWILASKLAMTSFEYAYRSPEVMSALGLAFTSDGLLTSKKLSKTQTAALVYLLGLFKKGVVNTRSPEFKVGRKGEGPSPIRQEFLERLARIVAGGPIEVGVDHQPPEQPTQGEDATPPETAATEGEGGTQESGSTGGQHQEGASGAGASTGASRGRNRQDTKTRLDMAGFAYNGASSGMRRRFEELKEIDVVKFPNATYDLLRTILECAGKEYLRAKTTRQLPPGSTLRTVLAELKKEFTGDKRVLGVLNQIDAAGPQPADRYAGTAQALNALNHEPDHFSSPADAHLAWDRIKPLVNSLVG